MNRRPWGNFEVLSSPQSAVHSPDLHQVKRLIIHPGQQISLQKHQHRTEHWFVVAGEGIAIVGDKTVSLHPRVSVDIPQETIHRARCTGNENLVLVEVQTGSYLGEDDIERIEDQYGRT
jgi:mannose-6-phosphate isomerase-like protein (cupin superfamily)